MRKWLTWALAIELLAFIVAIPPHLSCEALRDHGYSGRCYGPVVVLPEGAVKVELLGLGYAWWWPGRYLTMTAFGFRRTILL